MTPREALISSRRLVMPRENRGCQTYCWMKKSNDSLLPKVSILNFKPGLQLDPSFH